MPHLLTSPPTSVTHAGIRFGSLGAVVVGGNVLARSAEACTTRARQQPIGTKTATVILCTAPLPLRILVNRDSPDSLRPTTVVGRADDCISILQIDKHLLRLREAVSSRCRSVKPRQGAFHGPSDTNPPLSFEQGLKRWTVIWTSVRHSSGTAGIDEQARQLHNWLRDCATGAKTASQLQVVLRSR